MDVFSEPDTQTQTEGHSVREVMTEPNGKTHPRNCNVTYTIEATCLPMFGGRIWIKQLGEITMKMSLSDRTN